MKIVLIWASNDLEKYWNKILKDLISKWHTVIPVNPKEKEIEWIRTHINLWVIKESYDIIDFVVKPEITLQILEKYRKNILKKKIWCQPWSSDDKVKLFLENRWFKDYITDSCIMIEKIN